MCRAGWRWRSCFFVLSCPWCFRLFHIFFFFPCHLIQSAEMFFFWLLSPFNFSVITKFSIFCLLKTCPKTLTVCFLTILTNFLCSQTSLHLFFSAAQRIFSCVFCINRVKSEIVTSVTLLLNKNDITFILTFSNSILTAVCICMSSYKQKF